jgi:hypothetical protein
MYCKFFPAGAWFSLTKIQKNRGQRAIKFQIALCPRFQTWLDGHGNRHSDAMHVTERWRRISSDQLWYEHTIDDPKFYTKPWTITGWVMPLAPKDWEILEYACTAGNKDLEGGHLQPGALDGSGRNGSAIATPPAQR